MKRRHLVVTFNKFLLLQEDLAKFLQPYYISTEKTNVFEDTLLKLSGIHYPPKICCFDWDPANFDRMYLEFENFLPGNQVLFFKWLQNYDEKAAYYEENNKHYYFIDTQIVYDKLFSLFKAEITQAKQEDLEKYINASIKISPQLAASLRSLSSLLKQNKKDNELSDFTALISNYLFTGEEQDALALKEYGTNFFKQKNCQNSEEIHHFNDFCTTYSKESALQIQNKIGTSETTSPRFFDNSVDRKIELIKYYSQQACSTIKTPVRSFNIALN